MSEEPLWTTRDGSEVPVSRMDDGHLLNAYRLLRREGFIGPSTLAFYLYGPQPNGDGAVMAYEMEQAAVFDAPVSPFIDLFEAEIRRRGLEVCS